MTPLQVFERNGSAAAPCKVAIIGIGCLFPRAANLTEYWANIVNGVDAITEVPPSHWRAGDYFDKDPKRPDHTYAIRGGFLSPVDFPPLDFGITPLALEAIDTTQLLGLMVARQALEDAGYGPQRDFDRHRASVILGVTGTLPMVIPLGARLGHPIWRQALKDAGVPEDVARDVMERIGEAYVGWQEDSFPGLLGNVVAGRIANRLDLRGANCVVDAACASSLGALHLALLELSAGRCDLALTGGMDTFNDIFMYMCFSKTPALSPSGDARPFDAGGDGTVLGEGLGCVVLKRLADAERDGDRIYAVIRSVGASSDGKGQAVYAPSAAGQVRALRQAYQLAAVTPDTIELVEAHGTGTKAGDAAEVTALTEAFCSTQHEAERRAPWCALGSVKSQIGHTKAAAGAAGLIKVALALHHKVLPPTVKVKQPLEQLAAGRSPLYINTLKRPWLAQPNHPRRAAASSFGFGGANFHCVLEEHRCEKPGIDWHGDVQIAAFSADSREELTRLLSAWPATARWDELRCQSARTRAAFNLDHRHRLLLVLERDRTAVAQVVGTARSLLERFANKDRWSVPEGIYFGGGKPAGKLAMVFPGQGSQYVGMLRDLACCFPQLHNALEEANAAEHTALRLSEYIYPQPVFHDEDRQRNESALRATDVAQPALGAVSLGMLGILDYFGVRPDAVAGHSYGELVALHAAGCFDAATLHYLSRVRGQLMADAKGDRGGMLAVQAPLDAVHAILAEHGLALVVANKNAPAQVVLSGGSAEIARGQEVFASRNMTSRPLPVAAAFHSSFVAAASDAFAAALERCQITPPRLPVFANTTAGKYPHEPQAMRRMLARQLAEPVEFVRLIEEMHRCGVSTFVEVGADSRLTGLIHSILPLSDHEALALDSSAGKRSNIVDLARALAQLSAIGHPANLMLWDEAALHQRVPAKATMTVPLCGANHVKPKPKRPPRPVDRAQPPAVPERMPAVPVNLTAAPAAQQPAVEQSAVKPSPNRNVTNAADGSMLSQSLRMTQENLLALQKLGEQTANLHRQFLEGQDQFVQVFRTLLGQQQQLIQASLGLGGAAPAPLPAVSIAGISNNGQPPTNGEAPTSSPRAEVAIPRAPSPQRVLPPVMQQPPPPPSPPPAPAPSGTSVATARTVLLDVVAEKTGYPAEMLELGMELDSDLGIDSIKRVEIFSAVQERLQDAPVVKAEHLGTLRTLQQVVDFLAGACAARPANAAPAAAATCKPAAPCVKNDTPRIEPLRRYVLATADLANAERQSATLPADSEIWVTDDGSPLAASVAARLSLLGYRARIVSLKEHQRPPRLAGLLLLAPTQTTDEFLKDAFKLLQLAGAGLREAGRTGGAVFAAVSRMDGAFGLRDIALGNPTTGGLAGLAKTAAHEWTEVRCRALDLAAWDDVDEAALAVVEQVLSSGPMEVGMSPAGHCTLQLIESPLPDSTNMPLQPGDVVVITGGARGVTAEAAVALAGSFRPTLVLLGRSSPPGAERPSISSVSDEAEIKRALLAQAGGSLSPRELGERYARHVADEEVRRTLERIQATGAVVHYRQVDVRDEGAVRSALDAVRAECGPVKGLVHGAGVLADRLILDKTEEQFEQVYATKVVGLRNLLRATEQDELKVLALFSSSTARFGRAGQVDYAAANEVLNKIARHEARRRPGCRVVAVNWGPWDGGMVTPSLRRLFASEGAGLIPLEAGADFLVRELGQPATQPVEVVAWAGTALPRLLLTPFPSPPGGEGEGVRGARPDFMSLAFERTLNVETCPVLRSHVLNGRAVVPMALTIEWLGHGAMHGQPGLVFHGFNELRVLKGVVLELDQSCTLRVLAGKAVKQNGLFHVPVEMRSDLQGDNTIHARAEIILAAQLPLDGMLVPSLAAVAWNRHPATIYDDLLFHGPDLQGILQVESCSEEGIVATVSSAPPPASWIKQPLRHVWLADPLALDSSFQAMVLWTVEQLGARSLPCYAGSYRQYHRSFPADRVRITAQITEVAGQRVRARLVFQDSSGAVVARMDDYECVVDPSLSEAFRRNRLQAVNSE